VSGLAGGPIRTLRGNEKCPEYKSHIRTLSGHLRLQKKPHAHAPRFLKTLCIFQAYQTHDPPDTLVSGDFAHHALNSI